MKSLKELYRIGFGPSSSHTMAIYSACEKIKAESGEGCTYKAELYGSLAFTGKGHGTDAVVRKSLGEKTPVKFMRTVSGLPHPNTL